jgi:hypothetical protein
MTSIHVTADVYSGRKNPEWDLVGEQVTDFRARLTGLRADPAKVNERPDQLGYRGLILDMTSDGSTQRFVIASGTVIVEPTSSGARRVLLDPGRTLEKWVLRTGKNALGPDLLASLLADK